MSAFNHTKRVIELGFPTPWYGGIRNRFIWILDRIESGHAEVDALREMKVALSGEKEMETLEKIVSAATMEWAVFIKDREVE